MPELVLLSDAYRHFTVNPGAHSSDALAVSPSHHYIPDPDVIQAAQTVVLIGTFESEGHARQLAAALSVALNESGPVVAIIYTGDPSPADRILLEELAWRGRAPHRRPAAATRPPASGCHCSSAPR